MRLSHEAMLELGTDGRISEAARAHAQALDAAVAASVSRTEHPERPARGRAQARDLVGDMARVIAAAVPQRQTVLEQDFLRVGIDAATAKALFPAALRKARAMDASVNAALLAPA